MGACGLDALVCALGEDAVALLVRWPEASARASDVVRLVDEVLAGVMPDRCALAPVALGSGGLAIVVTPASGEPMTPLITHAAAARLADRLAEEVFAGTPADAPAVIPWARVPSVSTIQGNLQALDELLDTIVNQRLAVQFQPIVNLTLGRVYGFEALARLPKSLSVRKIGAMYEAADRARIVAWLDMSCHEKCVTEATRAGIREYLFLNMEAEGLAFMDEARRFVGDLAAEAGIEPGRIVLEITERQAVGDFERVLAYIDRVRARGLKVAIDDAGEGYSSLQTIMEMRPDFVKVGRQLVRGIDSSAPRRALLQALNDYSTRLGAAIIAEGIETRDELATVMDIGVEYGQGYLFARPKDYFRGLRHDTQALLMELSQQRAARRVWSGQTIGSLAREGMMLPPETPPAAVLARLGKNPEVESVVFASDGIVAGLLMRYRLASAGALLVERTEAHMRGLIDARPLTVEAETPLEEVADHAAFRREMRFQDDVIVTSNGRYAGSVSMRRLLEAVTALRLSRGKHLHPLTGLPGRVPLEQEFAARTARGEPVAVLRVKVAGLREHNRRFGFRTGDDLLTTAAQLVLAAARGEDASGAFVAHTAGATFHALVKPASAASIVRAIRAGFQVARESAARPAGADPAAEQETPRRRLRIVGITVEHALPDGFATAEARLDALEARPAKPNVEMRAAA